MKTDTKDQTINYIPTNQERWLYHWQLIWGAHTKTFMQSVLIHSINRNVVVTKSMLFQLNVRHKDATVTCCLQRYTY